MALRMSVLHCASNLKGTFAPSFCSVTIALELLLSPLWETSSFNNGRMKRACLSFIAGVEVRNKRSTEHYDFYQQKRWAQTAELAVRTGLLLDQTGVRCFPALPPLFGYSLRVRLLPLSESPPVEELLGSAKTLFNQEMKHCPSLTGRPMATIGISVYRY